MVPLLYQVAWQYRMSSNPGSEGDLDISYQLSSKLWRTVKDTRHMVDTPGYSKYPDKWGRSYTQEEFDCNDQESRKFTQWFRY